MGSRVAGIPRAAAALAALLALLAAAPPAAPRAEDGPRPERERPFTNEDVVRMTMRGDPADRIVEAIARAGATEFDLDPDVVVELRRVGVTEAVIQAMHRGRRTGGPGPAAEPPDPATPRGALALLFSHDGGAGRNGGPVVPRFDAEGRPHEIGFFALCVDQFHVPDMWQTRTPLREGFPRHHLIWHQLEAEANHKVRGVEAIRLALPERAEQSIDAGAHPLLLGLAVRSGGGAWRLLCRSTLGVQVPPERTCEVRVTLAARRPPAGARLAGAVAGWTCEAAVVDPDCRALEPPDADVSPDGGDDAPGSGGRVDSGRRDQGAAGPSRMSR